MENLEQKLNAEISALKQEREQIAHDANLALQIISSQIARLEKLLGITAEAPPEKQAEEKDKPPV